MILEAFSRVLKAPESQGRMPEAVLYDWLSSILLEPAAPDDNVAKIIHAEITLLEDDEIEDVVAFVAGQNLPLPETDIQDGLFAFVPRSDSGERLLNALKHFCRSYDHWQFCRWVHHVQASDFCYSSESES